MIPLTALRILTLPNSPLASCPYPRAGVRLAGEVKARPKSHRARGANFLLHGERRGKLRIQVNDW